MKTIISLFLLLTFSTLIYGFRTDETWFAFSSEAGNFSLLMPTQPKSESETKDVDGGSYTTNIFISTADGSVYLAGWVDYSFKVDTEAEIKANRDNLLKELNATLLTEKKITLDDQPGIEFTGKMNSGQFIKSRVYMMGNRPYQLLVIASADNQETTDKFLSSFKFTAKKEYEK